MRLFSYWRSWAKYNLVPFVRGSFGLGCPNGCGQAIFTDGVCVDHWPGYDDCARPTCGHYRCEHQFPGNEWSVSYSKENPEAVGEKFSWPVGCMVDDGPDHCAEFIEE
jgi:hypothetical protein